jgi:hypothetical protein
MKIEFRQSGGVAGIVRPTKTIDTATLPAAEADHLHSLVSAADFFQLPDSFPRGTRWDPFSYIVTIEKDGQSHTVQAQEGSGTPALDRLLEHLRQTAM